MPDFYQLLRVKGEGDALVDEARRIRSFGILKSLKMFEKGMIRTRLSKNSFEVNIKPGVRTIAPAIGTANGAPKGSNASRNRVLRLSLAVRKLLFNTIKQAVTFFPVC
jgi:hypothetical protein